MTLGFSCTLLCFALPHSTPPPSHMPWRWIVQADTVCCPSVGDWGLPSLCTRVMFCMWGDYTQPLISQIWGCCSCHGWQWAEQSPALSSLPLLSHSTFGKSIVSSWGIEESAVQKARSSTQEPHLWAGLTQTHISQRTTIFQRWSTTFWVTLSPLALRIWTAAYRSSPRRWLDWVWVELPGIPSDAWRSLLLFSRPVMSDSVTPGIAACQASLVFHCLPEFAQTHIHWVDNAIQPSHPLLQPSSPVLNLSHHQDLFQWVSSSQQMKSFGQSIGASASVSVLPMSIQGWFPLGLTGLISLLVMKNNFPTLAAPSPNCTIF